jgi:hypothetical protein
MVIPSGVPDAATAGRDELTVGAADEGGEGDDEEGDDEAGEDDGSGDAAGALGEEQAAAPNRAVRSTIRAFISTRTVPAGPARRIQERQSFERQRHRFERQRHRFES